MKFCWNSFKSLIWLGTFVGIQTIVKCEPNCDDNSKLQYETGKSYVYNVDITSYDATKEDFNLVNQQSAYYPDERFSATRARLSIKGKIVLTALPNCEYVLTLSDVSSDATGERYGDGVRVAGGSGPVPRKSVKFTFRNGEVSNLYKDTSSDSPWIVNIIRGILTTIQNKGLSNSDGEPEEMETNIRGECVSRVYVDPDTDIYKKTIDITQCSDPFITPSEGEPYTATHLHSRHGLRNRAKLHCTQKIEDNHISGVNCTEKTGINMAFRSSKDHVEIISSLQLERPGIETEEANGASESEISQLTELTSIVYDASINKPTDSWKDGIIMEVITLLEAMHQNPDINKAELYLQLKDKLIYITDFQELETELQQRSNDDILQSQFLWNMVRNVATEVPSDAAMIHVGELIQDGKMSEGATAMYYTHLHLNRNPSTTGMTLLVRLMELEAKKVEGARFTTINFPATKAIRQLSLGASGYAYQYCRRHTDCANQMEYVSLVNKIAEFAKDDQPDHMAAAALHALGNVPGLPTAAVKIIQDVLNARSSLFTGEAKKLTAFEAFRRDPCQPDLKQLSREKLSKTRNSHEMRTTAYSAVARCVDEADIKVIQKILTKEHQSPLASFIATHVHNVMDSQSPSKRFMQESLLAQIHIPDNIAHVHNRTNFSKYFEYSTFNPNHNFGVSMEGHVIFEKSGHHLPTYGLLNITLDIHGKSYNTFQIGLSRRFIPDFEKFMFHRHFFHHFFEHSLLHDCFTKLIPAFFGIDSFHRVFGTTVSMGIDVFDTFRPHEFFDSKENPETGLYQLDFVRPLSLFKHDVTLPTLSGFPLTITSQIASLPLLSLNHTGDSKGLGIWDVLSKWDTSSGTFRHSSKSEWSFIAGMEVGVGKGTPFHMGYHSSLKVHSNHTIEYSSAKGYSSNWEKKINFPEMIVWSKRITATRQFFVETDGQQRGKWDATELDFASKAPEPFFSVEAMGLRADAQILSRFPGPLDIYFKVEKTEEQFTGYSLDFAEEDPTDNWKKMNLKLQADGLSSGDLLEINFDHTHRSLNELENDDERPETGFTVYAATSGTAKAPTGVRVHYKSIGFPKSVLSQLPWGIPETFAESMLTIPTFRIIGRNTYKFKIDTLNDGREVSLANWHLVNNREDVDISLKLGGCLEKTLGTMRAQVTHKQQNELAKPNVDGTISEKYAHNSMRSTQVSTTLQLESEQLGRNKLTSDFTYEDHAISWNTTAILNGDTYDLIQTLSKPTKSKEHFADGVSVKEEAFERNYRAEYKDSLGMEVTLTKSYKKKLQVSDDKQGVILKNVSIRLDRNTETEPLIIEFAHLVEVDNTHQIVYNGLKRWMSSIYVDAFARKRVQVMHETNFTQSLEELNNCQNAVHHEYWPQQDAQAVLCKPALYHKSKLDAVASDDFEFALNNEKGESGVTFDATAYLLKSAQEVNFTLITLKEPGQDVVKVISTFSLDNIVAPGVTWKGISETEMDPVARKLQAQSNVTETTDGRDQKWITTIESQWAKPLLSGESTMSIIHEDPMQTVTSVDIKNDAVRLDTLTNTLTVLVDTSGVEIMTVPKKLFTWVYTKDDRLSEEERATFDYKILSGSDIKMEELTEPPREIFHSRDGFTFYKLRGQETWQGKGWSSVLEEGKNVAATDYSLRLVKFSNSTTAPRTSVDVSVAGWFEQELPELRNNTYSAHYFVLVVPHERMYNEEVDFHYQKVNLLDGQIMTTVEGGSKKDIAFKDWLHFRHLEQGFLTVDNKTYANQHDIRLDGPHLRVFVKNENKNIWIVDFDGGVFQEKHQHKLNLKAKIGHTNDRVENHHDHHHEHHDHIGHHGFTPNTNFNLTISRR